jgi:RHS repeat-associated protein
MSGQNPGEVKGYTGSGPAGTKNASAAAETPAELNGWDALQMLLDLGGMIPGLGAGADLLNAAVSAFRGDFWGAGLSLFSAIPAIGDAAGLAKIIKNGDKYLNAVKVVEQKLLPKLPPALRKKVEDYLAKIKAKLDELLGKKKETPPPKETASNPNNGAEVKGQGKKGDGPACPICPTKKNPVNPVLGSKILASEMDLDFELPGILPLIWQRYYVSHNVYVGWFGQGWSTAFEQRIEIAFDGSANFIDEFGRQVEFPAVRKGESFYSRSEQSTLQREDSGRYVLTLADGSALHFGDKREKTWWLTAISDRNGNSIRIERAKGYLLPTFIHTSSGQVLEMSWTDEGYLAGLYELRGIPDSTLDQKGQRSADTWLRYEQAQSLDRIALVSYAVDTNNDLRQVFNRAGELVREFGYRDHLLIAHRLGGVLEAFYEYEGQTEGLPLSPASRVTKHWANNGESLSLTYEKNQTVIVDESGNKEVFHFIVDSKGHRRWTGTTNPAGLRSMRTLDIHGNVLSVSDVVGNSTGYAYDDKGKPTVITDPSGAKTRLVWDDTHQLVASITDPLQRTTRFEYDENGNLATQTAPDGAATHFERDARGLPVAIVDAIGGRKTLQHNAAGQVISYTDCSNRTTTFDYDANGLLRAVTDPANATTQYAYDHASRLISETRPDGSTEQYAYDKAGRLIKHTDANGAITQYELAPDGLPLKRINALGQSLQYVYSPGRRLVELINENGAQYQFAYNPLGLLTQETGFDGKVTQYQYDDAGYLIEQTEAAGSDQEVITRYHRDLMGRLRVKTTGLLPRKPSTMVRFAYDAAGQLTEAHTEDTHTLLQYDAAGRLVRERQTAYHPQTDALLLDVSLEHRFDALGNRTGTTLPCASIQPKDWHEALHWETPHLATSTAPYYKQLNQLHYGSGHLHQINLEGQCITDFERDAVHREIGRSQGLLASAFELDALGRLVGQQVQRTGALPASLAPLLADHVVNQFAASSGKRPASKAARQSDTLLNPLLPSSATHWEAKPADGSLIARQYAYDPSGNLLAQQDWSRPVGYSYDALGRVLHAQAFSNAQRRGASSQERFAFDPAHNLLDPATQEAQSAELAQAPFDPESTQPLPQAAQSVGRLLNNRVSVFEDKRYSYDAHGRLTQKRIGRHTEITLHWSDEHQLMRTITHNLNRNTRQSTHYLYDAFGRRVAKWQAVEKASLNSAASESAASVAVAPASTSFVWDGNRLLQQRTAAPIPIVSFSSSSSPSQNAAGHSATSTALNCTTFLYESETFVPLAQLLWQEAAPAEQAQSLPASPNVPVEYVSNATDAANADLLHLPGDQLLGTGTDGLGLPAYSPARTNIPTSPPTQAYAPLQPLASAPVLQQALPTGLAQLNAAGISIRYYHCDQIGLPRELTDEAGAIVWRAAFNAWGTTAQEHQAPGLRLVAQEGQLTAQGQQLAQTSAQPLRLQGQYFDEETGLHYNRFRYYDGDVGRFCSPDPIGLIGGENVYQYAPNASAWIDTLGLARCTPCLDEAACKALKAKIMTKIFGTKETTGARGLLERIEHLLVDENNLYDNARTVPWSKPGGRLYGKGTYQGHIDAARDLQVGRTGDGGIRGDVAKYDQSGCSNHSKLPASARSAAYMPIPTKPAGR